MIPMRGRALPLLLGLLGPAATLALAQAHVVRGQALTITVRLADENGAPLAGVTVHFLDETDGVEVGAGVTDSDGCASVTWATSSASPGLHSILIWTEEGNYVEKSQTRLSVEVLAPAELGLSVSAPAAVRPGQSFVVRATVSNGGQAAAQDVKVKLGRKSKELGDLPGGASLTAEFSLRAPNEPGDYDLTVEAVGVEWGTGRALSVSSRVHYHVKTEGLALEIRAPYSVREGEKFAFSVDLSNVGEDEVSLSISINISGARPDHIEDFATLNPGASITRAYFATAGEVSEILLIASAEGGGLRASDEATIAVVPAPPPPRPPASRPTPTELTSPPANLTSPPSTSPATRLAPPSTSPGGHAEVEVSVTPDVGAGSNAPPSLRGASALGSGFVLAALVILRGVWRVEDP